MKPVETDIPERVICVGVETKSVPLEDLKDSLAELEDLVYAAGGEVVASFSQSLQQFNTATLMGKGKIDEIKECIQDTEATLVVVDHALKGSQLRNLEEAFKVGVLDRSQLILDIFAQRAKTYEGQLQVELAQMLDQLPRMVGGWLGSLSRQAGGIGTRGPGESALEMDRRRIRNRIEQIQKKLDQVRKNRSQLRAKRLKSQVPSFALIGYTNAGKSTLLNQLTHSDVLSKDQVFATLDPTTRKLQLTEGRSCVVTDTVGFIRKLPTQLIEAFKATLEESENADVLMHVIDLSSPQMQAQIDTVNRLIEELGWSDKPILHVYNKIDKTDIGKQIEAAAYPRVLVSATTGKGINVLKEKMIEMLSESTEEVELYIPLEQEHRLFELTREANVLRQERGTQGVICHAELTPPQMQKWKDYFVK